MRNKLAVIAVLVVAVMVLMAPALANSGYQERPPGQRPEVIHQPKVSTAPRVVGEGGALPFTGSDLALFVAAGALTVGLGAMAVRAGVKGARLLGRPLTTTAAGSSGSGPPTGRGS
jgi:hypothetical protein